MKFIVNGESVYFDTIQELVEFVYINGQITMSKKFMAMPVIDVPGLKLCAECGKIAVNSNFGTAYCKECGQKEAEKISKAGGLD